MRQNSVWVITDRGKVRCLLLLILLLTSTVTFLALASSSYYTPRKVGDINPLMHKVAKMVT